MKDNFAYKYFLLLNHIANKMNNHIYLNFAELIKQENEGKYMNSQMTFFFYQADMIFSEILGNDPEWLWDNIDMEEVAKIDASKLEDDYYELVVNWEDEDSRFLVFKW